MGLIEDELGALETLLEKVFTHTPPGTPGGVHPDGTVPGGGAQVEVSFGRTWCRRSDLDRDGWWGFQVSRPRRGRRHPRPGPLSGERHPGH